MVATPLLADLIAQHSAELKEIAAGVAGADAQRTCIALGKLGLSLAGTPLLAGLLSPFLEKGVQLAFASTATKRLLREYEKLVIDDDKAEFVARIGEAVEALLGQALIQLVRVQHQTKDELGQALGGLRRDLKEFRDAFADELARGPESILVDVQRVRESATGVVISEQARARIWIGEMTVSGAGSVGIHVRS